MILARASAQVGGAPVCEQSGHQGASANSHAGPTFVSQQTMPSSISTQTLSTGPARRELRLEPRRSSFARPANHLTPSPAPSTAHSLLHIQRHRYQRIGRYADPNPNEGRRPLCRLQHRPPALSERPAELSQARLNDGLGLGRGAACKGVAAGVSRWRWSCCCCCTRAICAEWSRRAS